MHSFCLMQLTTNQANPSLWDLNYYDPTIRHSSENENNVSSEAKLKCELSSDRPIEMIHGNKLGSTAKLKFDNIKKKIMFLFGDIYNVKFVQQTCKIKSFNFNIDNLYRFLFRSSVFSLGLQSIKNLKTLIKKLKRTKLKYISLNSLKLINKLSDEKNNDKK